MNEEKLILIGLDGIGYSEISEFYEEGTLQNIASVHSKENPVDLLSTHPPWTPCAWPSLLSGRNPGEHGVFDFYTRKGYDKELVSRQNVDSPYLFEVADACGLTPVVINFPVTHPATELENGAVVPGYLAREDVTFHPEELRERYEDEYGEYIIYPEYGSNGNIVEEYINVARCRRNMARLLNEQYDWDLMAVQFQVTDSVFHDLEDRNEIRRVLEAVDSLVGEIINLGNNDPTVIIASDHGMGDYDWTFYANSWLAEEGYCQVTEGKSKYFRQKKSELKVKDSGNENRSAITSGIKGVVSAMLRAGFSPQRVHSALSSIGVAHYIEQLLPDAVLVAAQNQVVDHENSEAFQLYFNSLGIHLNVETRDPSGVIPEYEYEEVRSEIIEKLKLVRDPDGSLVFDEVQPREEVYQGRHLEDAPDIILTPRDYRYDVSGSILDTFRRNPHKNHKPEGILFSNKSLNIDGQAEIYDIAPTVAAALGFPVDAQTDGTVLFDVEDSQPTQNWDELSGEYMTSEGETDTQSVEDRLADLGYME